MAKKKVKNLDVSVDPGKVMYTNISTSKDGYNSARMVVKLDEKQYMNISCEWEGADIPGFALDLMQFMQTNNVEKSGVWKGQEDAYKEFSSKEKKDSKE